MSDDLRHANRRSVNRSFIPILVLRLAWEGALAVPELLTAENAERRREERLLEFCVLCGLRGERLLDSSGVELD